MIGRYREAFGVNPAAISAFTLPTGIKDTHINMKTNIINVNFNLLFFKIGLKDFFNGLYLLTGSLIIRENDGPG